VKTRLGLLIAVMLIASGVAVATSGSASAPYSCTVTSTIGRCGPYDYPLVQGTRGGTSGGQPYVDQNEWGPISGEKQTLRANSPGDWMVTSTTPRNPSGSVTTFPNTGAPFDEQALSSFPELIGSFSETMPHTSGTSAWATYDNWFDDWKYEVMIQHDFVGNGPCDYKAVATFGGSNGVPAKLWGLCTYGSELIWKLAAPGSAVGTDRTVNESSGSVDIKAMINWLVAHKYMTANPTITNISYGWEISSTNGVAQNFVVKSYSLLTHGTAPPPPPSSSPPPARRGSLLIGTRRKTSAVDTNRVGEAEAFSYVAVRSGRSFRIGFYVDARNRATHARVGIYTDSGRNSPRRLLKQVAFRPKVGWNVVRFTGVSISARHKYWLAVLGRGGRIAFRDQGSGRKSEMCGRSGLMYLPARWTNGTAWNSGGASFYVSA